MSFYWVLLDLQSPPVLRSHDSYGNFFFQQTIHRGEGISSCVKPQPLSETMGVLFKDGGRQGSELKKAIQTLRCSEEIPQNYHRFVLFNPPKK